MVVRWFGILLCALVLNAQEVRLQVLETSDVHGQVMPENTFTLAPANQGWAKLSTLIRNLRTANPNTLLVDCGDATQGEPINYVWSRLRSDAPEPSTAIMNLLGYSAMVVGDHEFDGGFPKLRSMEEQAQFPWLAANVVFAGTGKRVFTPYLKMDVGGVQVAILGLTTAAMPRLADSGSVDGLVFQDAVATAKAMIRLLREKEKVDMVIVALHGGLGKLPCAPGDENQALGLAEQVPGIDLILTGHTHQQWALEQHGVPILQAGVSGQALGVGDFTFHKVRGKWEMASHQVRVVQVTADLAADPKVLELTAPLRAATDSYLNTFATTLATDLDGRWCRMEDTAVMHLLHTVARRESGAQITALSTPGSHLFIPRGPSSVRQFYALYPYDDHLVRITVTGRQLRAYLEHSARFFNLAHLPELFNKAVPPRDFDTLEGCTYTLDLSRVEGSRVLDLKVQGQPVKDDQTFTLGTTSYRAAGGGGFMEAMGWQGKVEFTSPDTFRNMLLDYVMSRPALSPAVAENWHTVPALDRERVLVQQP
jgi:2',3'-cyclic-nucleotide 2'-phosphodiesterase/3'-nucleotidase